MEARDTLDLAIVGCGVSGAMAAITAVSRGLSVAIFEEDAKVGQPSHCSGHVGITAFRQLAADVPRKIIENTVRGVAIYPPKNRAVTLDTGHPITWVLNRAELDRHLASTAVRRGAELRLNSRVEGFTRLSEGGLRLRLSDMQGDDPACKLLIDATGCGASISRYAGLSSSHSNTFVNSAQVSVENVKDVDPDFVEVYFGRRYTPGFFGWIIPRRDGSAKVGMAVSGRANIRQYMLRFLRRHPLVSSKVKSAKIQLPIVYHPIPIDDASAQTYAHSVLRVGDAASQVKPTTGGGIVFGMISGRIAGRIAAEAVAMGDTSESFLRKYEEAWKRMIGFDLKAMYWVRRLLNTVPDGDLDRIFSYAQRLHVDELVSRTSDVDFQGRTILSLVRDPRFFTTLLTATILAIPSFLKTTPRRWTIGH
jgi:digeranylgeranylglycerophospholipid reductase